MLQLKLDFLKRMHLCDLKSDEKDDFMKEILKSQTEIYFKLCEIELLIFHDYNLQLFKTSSSVCQKV